MSIKAIASTLSRLEITNSARDHIDCSLPSLDFPALQELVTTGYFMQEAKDPNHDLSTSKAVEGRHPFASANLPSLCHLVLHDCVIPFGASFPSMPALRVVDLVGGHIENVFSFLLSLNPTLPNLEYLSLLPSEVGRPRSDPVRFDMFTALVHVRLSTITAFIAFTAQSLPRHLRQLDIIEDPRATKQTCRYVSLDLNDILKAKGTYRELQSVNIVAIGKTFYDDYVELGGGGNWDVDMSVEFHSTFSN